MLRSVAGHGSRRAQELSAFGFSPSFPFLRGFFFGRSQPQWLLPGQYFFSSSPFLGGGSFFGGVQLQIAHPSHFTFPFSQRVGPLHTAHLPPLIGELNCELIFSFKEYLFNSLKLSFLTFTLQFGLFVKSVRILK